MFAKIIILVNIYNKLHITRGAKKEGLSWDQWSIYRSSRHTLQLQDRFIFKCSMLLPQIVMANSKFLDKQLRQQLLP